MLWRAMGNAEGKAWAVQKNRMLSFVHLTYANSSELLRASVGNPLCSSQWAYATVWVWPQPQSLLFLQSTHLPPMLWTSQLTKHDSRVKCTYFSHSMMPKHKLECHLTLNWRNNDWTDVAGKAVWLCWLLKLLPSIYCTSWVILWELSRGMFYYVPVPP